MRRRAGDGLPDRVVSGQDALHAAAASGLRQQVAAHLEVEVRGKSALGPPGGGRDALVGRQPPVARGQHGRLGLGRASGWRARNQIRVQAGPAARLGTASTAASWTPARRAGRLSTSCGQTFMPDWAARSGRARAP